MSKRYPQRGQVYTLQQIMRDLSLDDSPSLTIYRKDATGHTRGPLQNAHFTDEQLFTIPEAADSLWRYERTTNEWIPCFTYVGPEADLDKWIDFEPWVEMGGEISEAHHWATPKLLPRKQHVYNDDGCFEVSFVDHQLTLTKASN